MEETGLGHWEPQREGQMIGHKTKGEGGLDPQGMVRHRWKAEMIT